jgi:hypothetical protein
MSAQTPQSSYANRELDESKLAQTPHTGAHSWQSRIDAAIFEGSLRASSTHAEHQCRHWRHASIAPLMSGLETVVLAMKISFPRERVTIFEQSAHSPGHGVRERRNPSGIMLITAFKSDS